MTENPIDAAHPLTAAVMDDEVIHPGHYTSGRFGDIECWDFAGLHTYHVGNAIKYVWRHADKGKPEQDLRKALQYLERAREHDASPLLPGNAERAAELTRRITTAIASHELTAVYRAITAASRGLYGRAMDRITDELALYEAYRPEPGEPEPAVQAERPRYVSGGVLDLVGRAVTVPGRLPRSNIGVIATGQLAGIEAHRSGAAKYTLIGEGAGAVPTIVLVESGAIVEPVE